MVSPFLGGVNWFYFIIGYGGVAILVIYEKE
jgi:hypothetical protein